MTTESTPKDGQQDQQPDQHPEPGLFPRLSPEEYRARVIRYVYILMRLVFFALFVVAIWWLFGALGALLFPLSASLVLAYLIDPLIGWLEQRGLGRRVSIVICLGGAVSLLALIILFLVPPLVEQIGAIINDIPELIETIRTEWVPWIEERLRTEVPESVRAGLEQSRQRAAESIPQVAQRAGTWTLGAVSKTGQLLFAVFNFLLIPLFAYFFLRKFGDLKGALSRWMPVKRRRYTLELLGRMDTAVGDWFRGQIQVALLIGLLYTVGLAVSFGFADIDPKLGVAIGILSGMLNIIPYFGMIAASLLTTLVVLLNWPGAGPVMGILLVFLINQILEGYVIGPKILGDSVGLNPIAVIILLLIGGELAGIWGMLLVVPIAGAIRIIWPDLIAIYRETAFYQGRLVEPEETPDDA